MDCLIFKNLQFCMFEKVRTYSKRLKQTLYFVEFLFILCSRSFI